MIARSRLEPANTDQAGSGAHFGAQARGLPVKARESYSAPIPRNPLFPATLRTESGLHALLAMQKVEGSNPFSRLHPRGDATSAWRDAGRLKLSTSAGLIAFHRLRISKGRTQDEHPPARDEMSQVIRQALDVFARLLLEALHFEDLGDQHVIGLADGLSGYVRRPHKPPIRNRVQRPADDVAVLRHQTLKVLGQFRRTQLKPHEKGRRRTHPRSVMDNLNMTNGVMGTPNL